jgi:hypothetical protein
MLLTSVVARMPARISRMGKESQSLRRFAVGIPTLAKNAKVGHPPEKAELRVS